MPHTLDSVKGADLCNGYIACYSESIKQVAEHSGKVVIETDSAPLLDRVQAFVAISETPDSK